MITGTDRLRSVVLLAALTSLVVAPALAENEPSGDGPISFPATFERAWYRAEKIGFLGIKQTTGDLTVNEEFLAFRSKKRQVLVKVQDIRYVSLGQMTGGDSDTNWVVLAVGDSWDLVGFRDGRKFGYGLQTKHLQNTVLQAVRAAGSAQYAAPPGFEPYVELDTMFAMVIPEGWSTYHFLLNQTDDRVVHGTTFFLAEPLEAVGDLSPRRPSRPAHREIAPLEEGRLPYFFVDRRAAPLGMTCENLGKEGPARILEWLSERQLFGADAAALDPDEFEPYATGRCQGLRAGGRVTRPDGTENVLELRVVCDGKGVYLIGQRLLPEVHRTTVEPFEKAAASLKFSVVR